MDYWAGRLQGAPPEFFMGDKGAKTSRCKDTKNPAFRSG